MNTLPFVSVLDDQDDCRYPLTIYKDGQCERFDEGGCSPSSVRFGDSGFGSPVFCAKHFRDLHYGDHKQSHIEPMTDDELAFCFPANSLEKTTTSLAHTPGPWRLGTQAGITCQILDRDGHVIAVSAGKNFASNAQLIVAAPDLLEALDYLLDVTLVQDRAYGNELMGKDANAWELATQAIRRATEREAPSELRA